MTTTPAMTTTALWKYHGDTITRVPFHHPFQLKFLHEHNSIGGIVQSINMK